MRKLSETDPILLLFASKRKKYLSETGAPYSEVFVYLEQDFTTLALFAHLFSAN
jgi:hypothetical protein